MNRRIRHYIDEDGVFLHAGDLEESIRSVAQVAQSAPQKTILSAVADGLHGHAQRAADSVRGRPVDMFDWLRRGL